MTVEDLGDDCVYSWSANSSVVVGIVVKFELYELYFWLELYEL